MTSPIIKLNNEPSELPHGSYSVQQIFGYKALLISFFLDINQSQVLIGVIPFVIK